MGPKSRIEWPAEKTASENGSPSIRKRRDLTLLVSGSWKRQESH